MDRGDGARAKGAIVSKARQRANLRRALPARKQPHQLFHFTGGIDELAAPALRARAVGERQGPAMPHLEIDAQAVFPRALDLPATDERARRRDEVGAANEEPQAAFADVHDLSFQRHPGAGGNRTVHGQIQGHRRARIRAPLTAHGDLGEAHADRARPLLGDEHRIGGGELDVHPAELGDEGHLLALEQRRDRTPARERLDDDVLSHRVDQAQLPPRVGAACEERRERLAPSHQRAQHALDLVARSGHEARGKGDCARVGGAHCGSLEEDLHHHPARLRTAARAAEASLTVCSTSTAVSLPRRLRMRPSTITVSTFAGCAASTSMCAGSLKTPRFTARVLTMMRSARFPAFSDPTRSSTPIERAPSIVASSSTRRAGSLNSFSLRLFSMFWMAFMIANMSAFPESAVVSTDSPTVTPAARNSPVCGKPKPMRSSV